MLNIKKIFLIIVLATLTACGGVKESKKVQALQKKDKKLSCREILLEMNEADFYRDVAHKNKGPRLRSVLMPLGYISTYMNAEEAIEAAEARVSYLDRIYEIMRCEEKEEALGSSEFEGISYSYTPESSVPVYEYSGNVPKKYYPVQ